MDFVSFRREKKSIFFPLHRGVCGPPSACYLLGSQSRQIVKSFLLPQDLPSLLPRILLPTLLLILYLNICILFYFSSSLTFFLSWKTFTQILIRGGGGRTSRSREDQWRPQGRNEEASHTLLGSVRGHRAWPVTFLSQPRSHWALRAHFTSGQPVGWVKELPFNQSEADSSVLHSEGTHRTPAAGASFSGLFWWLFKKTFLLECSWFTMLC